MKDAMSLDGNIRSLLVIPIQFGR